MIGNSIGPYQILAELGRGGMGEVYLAVDSKLGRDVALKVLPAAFVDDPDRLARFQREARVLASLNHPNIAALYGFEDSGPTKALVMELVDGPTLDEVIASEHANHPRPGDRVLWALPIARQIAAALEAAHEAGIIHRDLKPANVKVRHDGTVKVLDFGLAKALEPTAPPGAPPMSASMSPTITTPAVTRMGMILGTAAYMSPEQARGRPVDRRSDVWAFGVVLYEMLTGRRAFEADDVSDTLAAVLRSDVDWSRLPSDLPPVLKTFLMRCLERDPRQRVPDIATMRLVMDGAFDAAATRPDDRKPPAPSAWQRAWPWAASLALAAATGLAVWSQRPESDRPVIRSIHPLPAGQTFRDNVRRNIAMAPDGSGFLYNTDKGLFVRELGALEARLIAGTEAGATGPVLSPDGQSIAFHQFAAADTGFGELRRLPIAGGSSVRLASAPPPVGMSWTADGRLMYGDRGRILEVPENGGDPVEVAAAEDGYIAAGPQALPGGEWILVSMQPDSGTSFEALEAETKIAAVSRSSGEIRLIRTGGTSARYLPSGHLVFTMGAILHAVAFDTRTLRTTGNPVPVVEGVEVSATGLAQFDVSDNGTLAYIPGAWLGEQHYAIALADRSGALSSTMTVSGPYNSVRASPDGTHLAVGTDDGTDAVIWIHQLGNPAAMRRLTFEGRNRFPIWSPDGHRVAFQSDREGDSAIFEQRADGTGGVTRLTTAQPDESHVPESWSPDGRHLSFDVVTGGDHALRVLTLASGAVAPFSDRRSREPFSSAFSPDGRWLAYHALPADAAPLSDNSGIYVEPFPATTARYQAPKLERDFHPVWSRDGAELIYLPSVQSGRVAISRFTTSPNVAFAPPALQPFGLSGGRLSRYPRAFDVLPDGRFVGLARPAVTTRAEGATAGVRFVVNWFEELRRLVPVR